MRHTYQQIAAELGVSHQRVMQIEAVALAKAFFLMERKGFHPDALFHNADVSFEKPLHLPELGEQHLEDYD